MTNKEKFMKMLKRKNLTLKELGYRIGMSESLLNKKLNEVSPFTIPQVMAIAKVLNLSDRQVFQFFLTI